MMRSRLEAKWAAFFDICGWRYEYEPYDCGGWAPDFLIIGETRETLVEVKPFTRLYEFKEEIEKIQRCTEMRPKHVLLLGVSPALPVGNPFGPYSIGWVSDSFVDDGWHKFEDGEMYFAPATFMLSRDPLLSDWFLSCGPGFMHSEFSYEDLISGNHISSTSFYSVGGDDAPVCAAWDAASNLVQQTFGKK